ncbi:hypothetical protein Bbelb_235710 [Branchiostoma belcheri]|nr:hypothetical protein Bbelb_235710 [Branchiostoma belcheri]
MRLLVRKDGVGLYVGVRLVTKPIEKDDREFAAKTDVVWFPARPSDGTFPNPDGRSPPAAPLFPRFLRLGNCQNSPRNKQITSVHVCTERHMSDAGNRECGQARLVRTCAGCGQLRRFVVVRVSGATDWKQFEVCGENFPQGKRKV